SAAVASPRICPARSTLSAAPPSPSGEVAGQILGDATAALDVLDDRLAGAEDMTISCAGLVRVDFSAAGTLLNWVSTHHAHGKRVHFCDVHRLVAGFFGVIGISELARVTPRKD
ncbi:MAG: STAS domain-containing protein, partial [Rubrivivax sp.]